MQDLVAGQLDFMIDQATNSLPQVNAGKIRSLRRYRQDAPRSST
jgi:tripartite-type tricarboxylate transporter receptor subunit TctC